MAAFVKFQPFAESGLEQCNLGSDVFRVALTNTAPINTQTSFDGVTNHPPPAAANGYPAGGNTPTVTSSSQTGGTYKLVLADTVFTATAGGIGPFRYVILYDDTTTAPADALMGYFDYGSSITLADTETFTVDFDPTNGVLQMS